MSITNDSRVTVEPSKDGRVFYVLIDGVHYGDTVTTREDAEKVATEIRAQLARETTIAGLRALADFLEQTPEAPAPGFVYARRTIYHWDAPDRDALAAMVTAIGGEVTVDRDTVEVKRDFGGVEYVVEVPAEALCEQRKVERVEYVLPPELTNGGEPIKPAGVL